MKIQKRIIDKEEREKLQWAGGLGVPVFLKIFTPEQCTKIINTALDTWNEKESVIQQTDVDGTQKWVENLDYRNTKLFSPPEPDDWLCSTIMSNIKSFNDSNEGYQFNITGMIESPNMMKYSAADVNPNGKPGKHDWHMDLGIGQAPVMRKLSYSILLNAGEYEGGELAFHIGRTMEPHPGQNSSDCVGVAIVFPSYLVHKVLDITKGIRYALVGWIHGGSFK